MGTIVQTVFSDPAPSNVGNLGGAGDTGGQAHVCVASLLGFQAGNYLLGIGETANFAGTTAVKFTDPVNGDWNTLEHLNARSAPGGVTDGLDAILAYFGPTAAIAPGFAGKISASGAGTATCTKFDGTAPNLSSFVGATFTEYSTGVTGTVTSVTGGSNNVLNFSGGGTPPVGNPMVVGGFIKFLNTSSGEDYTGATIVEVSGVNGLIGHNSNQNTFAASATVSTGTVAAWAGTGTAISFCADDEDDGTSPFDPLSATGTDDGIFWVFNLSPGIMRMQHQVVTSPGSAYGMNFTTQTGDHHMAYIAVFQDTPSVLSWQPKVLRHPGRSAGKGDSSSRFFQAPRAFAAPPANVTVSLIGQSATFTAGILLPATTVPLVGKSGTFAAGTLSPSTTVPLTGQGGTFSAGTLTPSTTIPLLGQAATFGSGLLTPSTSVPLLGQSATFSAGTMAPSTTVALTGQAAAFVAGTVTPGITVSIVGSLATFNAGFLIPSGGDASLGFIPFPGSPSLASPSNTFQFLGINSSVTNSNVTAALTGQSATFTAGTLSPATAVPLAGSSAAFTPGQVTPGLSVSMVGQAVTFAAGSMVPSTTVGLTGQSATFRTGNVTASGGDVTTTQVTIVYFIGNVGTLMGRQ